MEVVPGAGPTIHAKGLLFESLVITPPEKLPDKAKPPNAADIFLTYPNDAPDLHGVSGAPIWVEREHGELLLYGAPVFRIIGVENSVLRNGYVRGTKWFVVDKMITQLECGQWLDRLSEQNFASLDDEEAPLWREFVERAREQPRAALDRMLAQARERRARGAQLNERIHREG